MSRPATMCAGDATSLPSTMLLTFVGFQRHISLIEHLEPIGVHLDSAFGPYNEQDHLRLRRPKSRTIAVFRRSGGCCDTVRFLKRCTQGVHAKTEIIISYRTSVVSATAVYAAIDNR